MNNDLRQHIEHLQKLLKEEKNEDLRQYQSRMQSQSLVERRKQGVVWYPVFVEKARYGTADRLMVRLSRNANHNENHLFQSGSVVSIFSTAGENTEESESIQGVINQVNDDTMLITLPSDELPYWFGDGKLGVQLMFDENSYREMELALNRLLKPDNERAHELMRVMLGMQQATFYDTSTVQITGLNLAQNQALQLVCSCKDVAAVHGPPGTGKTTTLVEAVLQTLRTENQVLVCAPSNAAADLLVERIGQHGVNAVRVGNPARITPEVMELTLDVRISQHTRYKSLKDLRRRSEEYRRMAGKYKRNFGPAEREQRHLMYNEAKKLRSEADALLDFIMDDVLTTTRVIVSTLVGSNSKMIRAMQFSTVFIDEASQAIEPACWIPILKAQRVVFAGDHCQLPPTVKSHTAAKNGLATTLFERAAKLQGISQLLEVQYRMHEQIMLFSSNYFYESRLIAHDSVATCLLFQSDSPVEFIDTAGCGFTEEFDRETLSTANKQEAELLFKHLQLYLDALIHHGAWDQFNDVGIISPYRAQVDILREGVKEIPSALTEEKKIQLNTIDSFQGQERDIIYISLVRSNDKGEIGFLADVRRMNVAMTRARKKLVIIGDSATLGQHPFYSSFLDYVNTIDAYRSAYEFLY